MITDADEKQLYSEQVFQWVAAVALVIHEGKILLGKRLDEEDFGLYELPGGKLEVGETLKEALEREVLEETGIEIEPVNLDKKGGVPIFVCQVVKSGKLRVSDMIFLAKVKSLEGKKDKTEELDNISFYAKEDAKKLLEGNFLRSSTVAMVKKFIEGELDG